MTPWNRTQAWHRTSVSRVVRTVGLYVTAASIALASCTDTAVARNPPRDAGEVSDGRRDVSFVVSDAQHGAMDAAEPQCHTVRFALGKDASAACAFRFRETIARVTDVQVIVRGDAGSRYLKRTTSTNCNPQGWYWLDAPPNGAALSLCEDACRALRTAGVEFIDAKVGCTSPSGPM